MKYIIWISVLLTFTLFSRGEEEVEEMVKTHHIQKRSCNYIGEECTKDVDCCSMQCLCSKNACRCGKRPRPGQLKKMFAKRRSCGV